MNDNLYSVTLEYLGGSSRFEKKSLNFKKGELPNTITIERDQFRIKTFQWLEHETINLVLVAVGFLIGFLIGSTLSKSLVWGLVAAVIGALLFGQKQDRSKIVLTLLDGDTEILLYSRCNKEDFRRLSEFL